MSAGLLSRVSAAFVAGLSVAVLVAGIQGPVYADPADAADSTGPGPDPSSATTSDSVAGEVSRPDRVSAVVTARATGQPVEDVSQRDGFSRVLANPDGTWTVETAAEPERVRDAAGAWRDIDTTLVETDGGFAPAFAAAEVVFSAGGDRTFAAVAEAGRDLKWRWTGESVLPAPVVEGDTATYRNVVPGGDLVVTALSTGFSHSIVLHEQPAGPVEFTVPVVTDGATLSETPQGGLTVETPAGREIVSAPQPLMWDAAETPAGDPANVAPVDTTVGKTPAGTPTITLAPDAGFLADPDTMYPVTVDPSFTTYASGDAWVQNAGYTTGQTASKELRAGTYDGGGHVARSYIHFDGGDSKWRGKKIESAKLVLRNFYSGSCTGAAIEVRRLSEAWDGNTLTWANRPSGLLADKASFGPAYGYTSTCDADDATWNVTDMVQVWANDTSKNHGLSVLAANETSNYTWRKYRSANYNDHPATEPHLNVTYNSYPTAPAKPTVSPNTAGYTSTKTPTFKATVSDPDGGQVYGKFEVLNAAGSVIWSKTSEKVSNNGTATVTVPSTSGLADGAYTVRVKSYDGKLESGWSPGLGFTVDTTKPTMLVTATAFTKDFWTEQPPTSNTFKLDGPADAKSIQYSIDGGAPRTVTTLTSGGDTTFDWAPTSGWHTVKAQATDKAGNPGDWYSFSFGVGPASLTSPEQAATSIGTVPLEAEGRPGATGVELSWRYAGKTAWTAMNGVTTTSGGSWSMTPVTSSGKSTTGRLVWDTSAQSESISLPSLLEVQACFTYPTAPTRMCTAARSVELASAFGGDFPTSQVGPMSVALATGEAALVEADAVDTQAGLGRSFSSFHAATTQAGPFGPGWSAALLAAGEASAELVDHRTQDHTLVVVTAGGGSQVFTPVSPNAVVTDPVPAAVEFRPAGADDGSRITLGKRADHDGDPNTAMTSRATLTRPLGPVTVWEHTTDDGWTPVTATGSAVTAKAPEVGFASEQPGYPTWIAQTEPGTSTTCTEQIQEVGCRGLKVSYSGDVSGPDRRVSGVERVTAGEPTVTMATYHYNTDGLLDRVCGADPDDDPANAAGPLCASYTYTTVAGRTLLSTLTPPGQAAWTFHYDRTARLEQVTRPETTGTVGGDGTATWTVRYDLPLAMAGLPDLSPAAAAQWGQEPEDLPATAAAVFPPARVPATSPTAEDLKYANLWFYDAEGTTTNTAAYGAGTWLVDTSWYDTHGNVIQTLDGAGRARALAEPITENQPAVAEAASTLTVYNDNPTGEADDEGTRVEEEYGPAHQVTLQDGTDGIFRSRTEYVYDDEPAGAGLGGPKPADWDGQTPFDLVVETRHSAVDLTGTETHDLTLVRNEYDPVVPGDGNGWELGMPTRVKTQLEDGTWSVQVTRYDPEGRQIETRQPGGATNPDGSGADAHATVTRYYAKNDPASDAACKTDGHPERASWVGLVCTTGPAAQPTGQSMPITYYKTYDAELRPVEVLETSGTNADGSAKVARTTTTSYDNLGRPVSTTITGGGDTRTNTIGYAPDSGLPTGVRGTGDPVSTGYDTWGRVTSYTDGTGMTSTTRYTPEGDIATFDDGEGTYTYRYRNTAAGEYRPLPVSVDVGLTAGTQDEFRLAYNAAGAQTRVTYPNGMTADYGYTDAGVPINLDYTDATGTPLLGFTATVDADGRVHGYTSDASRQDYTLDNLGRLTKTRDYRTNPDTDQEACTTRTYGFSPASERTSYRSYAPAAADGSCQTSTPAVAKTNSYDPANRITNPGYSYDNLGRTLTTPAADTTPDATSALSAAYHANDMIKTLTQTVSDGTGGTVTKQTDYTLDATGRINHITNKANNAETNRLRYQFAGSGDSPTSVQDSLDGGTTWTTTRYLTIPGVGMTASVTGGVITYQLANLHGDIISTASASGVDDCRETDEYGGDLLAGGSARYGWLGRAQRSADTIGGLTLMGARIYNPRTGLFFTMDPVAGGNATRFGYPEDPINLYDTTGMAGDTSNDLGNSKEIFDACRDAGGSIGACGAVVSLAIQVARYVAARITRAWKQNAVRHFVWQAATTIFFGKKIALAIASAHESGSRGSVDSDVDLINNRRGRRYALGPVCWNTSGGFAPVIAALFDVGVRKWRHHRLASGSGGTVHAS